MSTATTTSDSTAPAAVAYTVVPAAASVGRHSVYGRSRSVSSPVAGSSTPSATVSCRAARPAARRPAAGTYGCPSIHSGWPNSSARGHSGSRRAAGGGQPVEVPPAGPVADRVERVGVGPLRLQHRLGLAAEHGPHGRSTVPSGAEHADPQLGAVPRHPRVVPGDPGDPPAVRRRPRGGEEVAAADDLPHRRGSAAPAPDSGTATSERRIAPSSCASRTHHTSPASGAGTGSA